MAEKNIVLEDLSKPENLQKLKDYLRSAFRDLDQIYTTTAPNGNTIADRGRIALYNNSGTYTIWINVDGITTWQQLDADADSGDMLKATYDTDADGIVDKAETVDDGAGNASTAANVKDAVTKKHTQNADTALGAQSEDLDMNTHKIVGVTDPATDQEAATKKYVDDNIGTPTPSDAVIKAWASVTYAAGTPTLNDNYNVSGITDTGVGVLTVTWDTDFASVNHAVVATRKDASVGSRHIAIETKATSSVQLGFYTESVGSVDPVGVDVIAIGDQ